MAYVLSTALAFHFPDALQGRDYVLQDDGDGPFIKLWSPSLGAIPTDEELQAWFDEKVEQDTMSAWQVNRSNAYRDAMHCPFATLAKILAGGTWTPGSEAATLAAQVATINRTYPEP